jgi:hypothetical protein
VVNPFLYVTANCTFGQYSVHVRAAYLLVRPARTSTECIKTTRCCAFFVLPRAGASALHTSHHRLARVLHPAVRGTSRIPPSSHCSGVLILVTHIHPHQYSHNPCHCKSAPSKSRTHQNIAPPPLAQRRHQQSLAQAQAPHRGRRSRARIRWSTEQLCVYGCVRTHCTPLHARREQVPAWATALGVHGFVYVHFRLVTSTTSTSTLGSLGAAHTLDDVLFTAKPQD